MNSHDYEVIQALKRVEVFAESHAGGFPPESQAVGAFARVTSLLGEAGDADLLPGVPASQATEAKTVLFEELWEDLKAIAATARTINRKEPGFAAGFHLGDDSQRSILAMTETFLESLEKPGVAEKFIAFDLPAGFVKNLRDDRAKITGKTQEQADDLLEATGDTARTRALILEGRDLLKRLDTSIRNRFRRNTEVMAQWRAASRIHRTPRAGTEEPAPPADGESPPAGV